MTPEPLPSDVPGAIINGPYILGVLLFSILVTTYLMKGRR
jgi:hypothetical protein